MATQKEIKKNVWQNIYRLVKPYKRNLIRVFFISLLATAVTLIEPLIYREAVNDIAGLFVQRARNDVKEEMGMPRETPKETVLDILGINSNTDTTTVQTTDQPTTAKAKTEKHHTKKKRVKQAHTSTNVAPRTPSEAFDTLLWAVILLFIINIVGLILWWIGENMNIKLSCTIERKFIQKTFGHVLQLPLLFFTKKSSSALHSQIDQSEEISGTVTVFTKDIFPEIISLSGIIAIMFWQNYIMALLALSIVPIYLYITIKSTRKLEKTLSGYYEKWETVSARMQDALTGIKTVKLSGAEEREVAQLDKEASEAYSLYTQRSFLANKYSFWQVFLTHVASFMVLVYGGYLALNHKLTPGDVVMFVTYLDMLYDPIDNLAGIWSDVQQNITSIARAFRLLDTSAEIQKGEHFVIKQGKVEFKNVVFGYNPDHTVLKGLSLKAMPGKVTGLVGTSGAGKTTTVDLLLKLFDPQQGEILIDNQKLSTIEGSVIRQQIGMVSADGATFRGTLADNIRYKKPNATNEEVARAADAAGMKNTLLRLPDGIKTMVGEGGFGLSVGERQRLQIARVLVSKPKILVLDEATANLDYVTESEVKKTIDEIRKENTVIIIAHRYSMIKDADYIYVLDDGQVIEEGSPAKLIEQSGWFADFCQAADNETEEETEEDVEEEETDEEDE